MDSEKCCVCGEELFETEKGYCEDCRDGGDLEDVLDSTHAPWPWTQGTSPVGKKCVWLNGSTEPTSDHIMGPDSTWIDCNTEANARRIVACVKACEGIDTEYLEGDDSLPHYARRLMAQRDELLAALHAYRDAIHFSQDKLSLMSAIADADTKAAAIIAKVEGGAA